MWKKSKPEQTLRNRIVFTVRKAELLSEMERTSGKKKKEQRVQPLSTTTTTKKGHVNREQSKQHKIRNILRLNINRNQSAKKEKKKRRKSTGFMLGFRRIPFWLQAHRARLHPHTGREQGEGGRAGERGRCWRRQEPELLERSTNPQQIKLHRHKNQSLTFPLPLFPSPLPFQTSSA